MSQSIAPLDDLAARIPDAPPTVAPSRAEIAAVASLVAETFKPRQIVLFGSRAYGVPRPDSDVDLMVVMQTPDQSSEQIQRIEQAIRHDYPGHWQVFLRTPAQIRRGLAEHDFFIRDAMLKGITLYERDAMDSDDDSDDELISATPGGIKHATLEWLERAEGDFDAAFRLREGPRPLLNHVGFQVQQAIEKYLKALLQENEIEFPRTHDLVLLTGLCGSLLPELGTTELTLDVLSEWAVVTRYLGPNLEAAQVDEALQIMTTVRTLVRAALGQPTT